MSAHEENPIGTDSSPDVSWELGRHIYGRYFGSPGLISTPGNTRTYKGTQKFLNDRLPLLAWIQRRWAHLPELPGAWRAPVYFWPSWNTGTETVLPNVS